MIKSLIVLSIFSGFVVLLLSFDGLFTLILQFKGTFIWILSLIYSKMTIFVVLSFLMYEVIHKFFKKI